MVILHHSFPLTKPPLLTWTSNSHVRKSISLLPTDTHTLSYSYSLSLSLLQLTSPHFVELELEVEVALEKPEEHPEETLLGETAEDAMLGVDPPMETPPPPTFIERWILQPWWDAHIVPQPSTRDNLYMASTQHHWSPLPPVLFWLLFSALVLALEFIALWSNPIILYWLLIVNSGYLYITAVTCARSTPFLGRHGGFRDLILINVFCTGIWFIWARPLVLDLPSQQEYGLLWAAAPYWISLHFSYLGRYLPRWARLSLSARHLSKANAAQKILILVELAVIAAPLFLAWEGLVESQRVVSMAIGAAVLASVIGTVVYIHHANWYLHLHHWFLSLIMIPVVAHPEHVTTALFFACTATFIEGAARWSMAPLLHKRERWYAWYHPKDENATNGAKADGARSSSTTSSH